MSWSSLPRVLRSNCELKRTEDLRLRMGKSILKGGGVLDSIGSTAVGNWMGAEWLSCGGAREVDRFPEVLKEKKDFLGR